MLIRYIVELRDPIILEDHWPLSIMGGDLRAVSKGGKVIAIEITFSGQPVHLAPAAEAPQEGEIKLVISPRDTLLPFVKMQLEEAFSYIQCYFDLELLIDEIEAKYVGETEEEEAQIKIKSFKSHREKNSWMIPYDIVARALMAGETGKAPRLEANFLRMARTEMLRERYIDSFRYSFLLIESVYGEGKFRAGQLKDVLKANTDFVSIVTSALKTPVLPRPRQAVDPDKLLSKFPTAGAVIDHIVDKRGFYFHGNVKRKDVWRPHEQKMAETLCLLSFNIATLIAQSAAMPMFDDALSQRYVDSARRVGAIMSMNVNCRFHEPTEAFDREATVVINIPGTKVTPKMAVMVAKEFLDRFADIAPCADLKSARCTVAKTGQKVFDIDLHVEGGVEADEC